MPTTTAPSAPSTLDQKQSPFQPLTTQDMIVLIADMKRLDSHKIKFEGSQARGYLVLEERPIGGSMVAELGLSLEWSDRRTVGSVRNHGIIFRLEAYKVARKSHRTPLTRGPLLMQFFQANAMRCTEMDIVQEIVASRDKEEFSLRVEVDPEKLGFIEVSVAFESFRGENKVMKHVEAISPSIFDPNPHLATQYIGTGLVPTARKRWRDQAEAHAEEILDFVDTIEDVG